MSRWIALIVDDATAWDEPGAFDEGMAAHERFSQQNKEILRGGDALKASSTKVRRSGDGFAVTDAALSETKEALGGFYLFEAPDHAAAVAVAQQVPVLRGWIELREIQEFD